MCDDARDAPAMVYTYTVTTALVAPLPCISLGCYGMQRRSYGCVFRSIGARLACWTTQLTSLAARPRPCWACERCRGYQGSHQCDDHKQLEFPHGPCSSAYCNRVGALSHRWRRI